MSETKDTGDSRPKISGKTLSLRRSVDTSHVRQNFSHGRSKSVLVEKKKRKRAVVPGAQSEQPAAADTQPARAPAGVPEAAPEEVGADADRGAGVVLRTLTDEEKDARAQALVEAREREAVERKSAELDAQLRKEEDDRRRSEEQEAEARRTEEESRRKTEEDARQKAEQEAGRRLDEAPASEAEQRKAPEPKKARKGRGNEQKPVAGRKGDTPRRRGKLTISNALDDTPRQRSMAAMRRQREREKKQAMDPSLLPSKISREVVIPEAITIQELANRMAERAVDVIKLLMQQGQMMKINDALDADTAQLIVEEMGHIAKRVSEADVEEGILGVEDEDEDMQPRAPVVTVMGHVDHGKTSLLDALRHAKVAAGEAGGITQHIGAYQVTADSGGKITFIDTPGHAAFTAMRARGAKVTDIVVLVVAADDGVMPQTVEAISHAREAGVPIIVAVNKIDKQGADPNRVRTDLLQHEIVPESMGGDTLEVEVSATEGTNLDKLIDAIHLQAEVLELRANPDRAADGAVIEAKVDKGRGPVATVLVQRGTVSVGDIFIAGSEWGRVRALINDLGENVDSAGPSVPVEVLGLTGAPNAGDQFAVVDSEGRAREITEYRQRKRREVKAAAMARGSLEQMMNQLKEEGRKEVPILIKADVQGSNEAIVAALEQLGTDEVSARVVHNGVGGITESDVTLATASEAVIIGFNVRANQQAREAAEQGGIEIRYYNVIYNLVDDIKAAMSGMLSPELREEFLGNAEILEVFNVSKVGKVAGCRVTEGMVERGAKVRLIRDSVVIHEGTLSTLKRFKDEVKEVRAGQECGMAFENYQDIREGDVIECYRVEQIARTLD
ncbi:MAG: translation initiation factor IF-2 [Hyphomicrobiales bacterium]